MRRISVGFQFILSMYLHSIDMRRPFVIFLSYKMLQIPVFTNLFHKFPRKKIFFPMFQKYYQELRASYAYFV
jgi:hypothetical protein